MVLLEKINAAFLSIFIQTFPHEPNRRAPTMDDPISLLSLGEIVDQFVASFEGDQCSLRRDQHPKSRGDSPIY